MIAILKLIGFVVLAGLVVMVFVFHASFGFHEAGALVISCAFLVIPSDKRPSSRNGRRLR